MTAVLPRNYATSVTSVTDTGRYFSADQVIGRPQQLTRADVTGPIVIRFDRSEMSAGLMRYVAKAGQTICIPVTAPAVLLSRDEAEAYQKLARVMPSKRRLQKLVTKYSKPPRWIEDEGDESPF